jgi:hypothetical protein
MNHRKEKTMEADETKNDQPTEKMDKGPLNPVVTDYSQAVAHIKANPGSWVQRTDWPSNQWIFEDSVKIIKCHLPSGEIVDYQTIPNYNVSEDNQESWQPVGG